MRKSILYAIILLIFFAVLSFAPVRDLDKTLFEGFDIKNPVQVDRAITGHVAQRDIDHDLWKFTQLRQAGERLFKAKFTRMDGVGRPGATGFSAPTRRPLSTAPLFHRTVGSDANSCFGCHNSPASGGAGEFVVNAFIGPHAREPIIESIESDVAAERGTPSMNGSGAIELLAREMTKDLHNIRELAIQQAMKKEEAVRLELKTKGISFGFITGLPDGNVKLIEVEGVDRDLVIRPWNQKGTVTSLRTFTVNAMNQHHGIQAIERFGLQQTGSTDFDRDGIRNELSVGDITALTVYQASLNVPGRVLPANPQKRMWIKEGEDLFNKILCNSCHIPELPLDGVTYTEPGPYNLEGTTRISEVEKAFSFDLTKDIPTPRLEVTTQGKGIVRAFTDLKRHVICDDEYSYFCNETLVQGFAPYNEFLTKRLWDVGNTAPYGHRGDLMTLREAILHHGGEATTSRLHFESLSLEEQDKVIQFLKSMQILPEGSQRTIIFQEQEELPYASHY